MSGEPFFLDARVSAIRFPGTSIGKKMIDRQEIGGTVVEQLERAVSFVVRNVAVPATIIGMKRESTEVPRDVWREALTNALCHRDYNASSQVRVFVFDDRVEIVNPGSLLNEMTVEGIRLVGTSQRRNPYLTAVLMHLGYVETLGFGVPEMIRVLVEAGLPEPEIRTGDGEFRIAIRTVPTEVA